MECEFVRENKIVRVEYYSQGLSKIVFLNKLATDEEFGEFIGFLGELYAIDGKFIQLVDSVNAPLSMRASHRLMLADFMRLNQSVIKRKNIFTVFLVRSLAHRLVLDLIFSLTEMPTKYKIINNEKEVKKIIEDTLGVKALQLID